MKTLQTVLLMVVLLMLFGGCNKKSEGSALIDTNESIYSVDAPLQPGISDPRSQPPLPPSF